MAHWKQNNQDGFEWHNIWIEPVHISILKDSPTEGEYTWMCRQLNTGSVLRGYTLDEAKDKALRAVHKRLVEVSGAIEAVNQLINNSHE